jgi:hypothetical protein
VSERENVCSVHEIVFALGECIEEMCQIQLREDETWQHAFMTHEGVTARDSR